MSANTDQMTVRILAIEHARASTAAQTIHPATPLSDIEHHALELSECAGSSCAGLSTRLTGLEVSSGDS